MARRAKTIPAPLIFLGWILASIGKPFYFIFSRLIIFLAFVLYLIGHTTRLIFTPKPKKVVPPKKKVKRVKVKKERIFFKLFLLKIKLFLIKLVSKLKSVKLPRKIRVRPVLLILIALVLSFFVYSYLSIFRSLPSPKNLTERAIDVSTKIYDRNGILLYKIYKEKNRTIVPLSQIPPHVRFATLAAEDAEFYSHPGFSVRGIFRALSQDISSGKLQGGSTITQQLVKNALLTPEKTLTRKIREVILSIEVEVYYSKDQILEMYLNEVSFGGTAYGIQEASQQYFGKDVGALNLAEAAFLAGLPQSPTKFSPFGEDPSSAFVRQREVLHLMVVNRYITGGQEEEAINTPLTFVPNRTQIKAPHFVMYIRQLLVDKYGEDMVEKGGLEVTTTLDLPIEELAERVVAQEVAKLKGLNVGNGAALVLNPQTGEILAMVGSRDYFDLTHDGNVNVTTRLRQPGSSIKVVNYAYALGHSFTPATILDDSPITFSTPGTTPYSPVNYDGKFKGKIPLRIALAESRNIPAVKVLASYGVGKMIETGKSMGITTWDKPSDYGLSLTLGGGAVKLTELSQVYATIANGGNKPTLVPILQVKDYKGRVLQKNGFSSEAVLDPKIAFQLVDILRDNNARSGEFGINSALVVQNHPEVAVKTGTSNDLRDNLTLGFNQNYLVATWVGNNDNSPMSRIASGITGAAPIWNKIISALLTDKPSIDWKVPEGLVKVNCLGKGEWFIQDKVPATYCKPTPTPGTENKPGEQKVPQIL